MTRARPKFTPNPRVWSDFQLACRLNKTEPWLKSNRGRLEAEGLPQRDPLLDGTDADAVEAWLDARSGLAGESYDGGLGQRLEALRNGTDPS